MLFDDDDDLFEEFLVIFRCDDKERLLQMLSDHNITLDMSLVSTSGYYRARKCLLALIEGEGCVPPAQQLYTSLAAVDPDIPTPLMCVASSFPEACDIIELLLKRGPVEHANIKYSPGFGSTPVCPLDDLLDTVSRNKHLKPWNTGDSLYKLIIAICQSEMRSSLQSVRLLVPHTDGINDIAWTHVRDGRLASLAVLLLVAQEQALVPFDSGLTIPERIVDLVDTLSSEGDLDVEGSSYLSMLKEASKLFEIFERAGGALSLYCCSMLENVPFHKIAIDIASVLKMAGYVLQPMDLDLRECYSENPDVYNASVYKVSNPVTPNIKCLLPTSLSGVGATRDSIGDCRLFHKLKAGSMVNLMSSTSTPRLLSTVAGQINGGGGGGSGIPLKNLASIAFRLARGIKF